MARRCKNKKPIKRMVIICGSEKTEPIYFNAYKRHLRAANIHVEGIEVYSTPTKLQAPDKLLNAAVDKVKEMDLDLRNGDTIWCVFDYDDFDKVIQETVGMKKYRNVEKIISNRCFELWYVLHYKYSTKFIQKTKVLEEDLQVCLGEDYMKNADYFAKLLINQTQALANAQKLEEYHLSNGTVLMSKGANPYTNVYRIVEFLNSMSN